MDSILKSSTNKVPDVSSTRTLDKILQDVWADKTEDPLQGASAELPAEDSATPVSAKNPRSVNAERKDFPVSLASSGTPEGSSNPSLTGAWLAGTVSSSIAVAARHDMLPRHIARGLHPSESLAFAAERKMLLAVADLRYKQLDAIVGKSLLPPFTEKELFKTYEALGQLRHKVGADTGLPLPQKTTLNPALAAEWEVAAAHEQYQAVRRQYADKLLNSAHKRTELSGSMQRANLGALVASEVGKLAFERVAMDSTPAHGIPASLRTTLCDVGASGIFFTKLPWYAKAGVTLGTHSLNRFIDSLQQERIPYVPSPASPPKISR